MADNLNIIKRQIWEIELSSTQNAFSLQNEWGQLNDVKISPILNQVCNELVDKDTLVKIDKMELDIDAVDFQKLETDLPNKVREAFSKSLEKLLSNQRVVQDKNVIITSSTQSDLDIIRHFLYTGTIPWWASKLESIDLETSFKKILLTDKSEVKKLLKAGIYLLDFISRLVNQFSEELLLSLAEVVTPDISKAIPTLFKAINKQYHDQKRLMAQSDLDSLVWIAIFSFIDKSSGKLNVEKLTQHVHNGLRKKFPKMKTSTKAIQDDIKSASTPILSNFELIKSFLTIGILPANNSTIGNIELTHLFEELLVEPNGEFQIFLKEGIKSAKFRTRLVYHFPPHIILSIIEVISPVRAVQIDKAYEELLLIIKNHKGHLRNVQIENFVWNQLLASLSSTSSKITSAELVENVLKVADNKWSNLKAKSEKHESWINDLSDHEKLELIIHFMNTGILPWWVTKIKNQNISVVFNALLFAPSRTFANFLRQGIKHEAFRNRLTSQFTAHDVERVIEILEPIYSKRIFNIIEELELRFQAVPNVLHKDTLTRALIIKNILTSLEEGATSFNTKKWVASLLKNISLELHIPYEEFLETLHKRDKGTSFNEIKSPHSLLYIIEKLLIQVKSTGIGVDIPKLSSTEESSPEQLPIDPVDQTFTEEVDSTKVLKTKEDPIPQQPIEAKDLMLTDEGDSSKNLKNIESPLLSESSELSENPNTKDMPMSETYQKPEGSIPKEQDIELIEKPVKGSDIVADEIYIENAGMVILWPYLLKFFEHLKLVENNEFKNRKCSDKAMHLLQYLVSGKKEQPEYHFPLNKIMCGLAINEPIPRKLKLKKKEIDACEELLQGVIKNWTALKNTSVDGLRETFLKREGRLSKKGKDWNLKINQKAYDVLMEKLPWGIGLIKLPWMPGILYVEW